MGGLPKKWSTVLPRAGKGGYWRGNGRTGRGGMRMKRRGWIVLLATAALVVMVNAAAWKSSGFCDWYVSCVYPLWVSTYGRLTGLLTFSVGEWMLVAGVVLTAAV